MPIIINVGEQAADPALLETMGPAVQSALTTMEAAVQATDHGPSPPTFDVAVQADDLQHSRPSQDETALQMDISVLIGTF